MQEISLIFRRIFQVAVIKRLGGQKHGPGRHPSPLSSVQWIIRESGSATSDPTGSNKTVILQDLLDIPVLRRAAFSADILRVRGQSFAY